MHQKRMLIDDRLAIVGSANFENTSFRLNFEITGAVADREFSEELERMLKHDISHSEERCGYRLEEQSLWEHFKARASSLLAPVL